MVFTHAFVGSAIASYNKNSKYVNGAFLASILGSVFPDFDLLLVLFNPTLFHRELITHSFVPYTLIFLLILVASKVFSLKNLGAINFYFYMGVLSHLFLDAIAGGLSAFAPFTYDRFGIDMVLPQISNYWPLQYLMSKYMVLEIIFLTWFLYRYKSISYTIGKILPVFFFFVAVITLIIVNL